MLIPKLVQERISFLINTGELILLNKESRRADGGVTKNFTDDIDTEEFKAKHLLTIEDGLLKFSGQPFTSILYVSHDKQGFASFVIRLNGSIYIFNHRNKTDKVAHSSFGGIAVRGAGEIKVRSGKITHISSHSGHYRPDAFNMYRILQFFKRGDVLSPTAIVAMMRNPFLTGTPLPEGTFSAPPAYNDTLRDGKDAWERDIAWCKQRIVMYTSASSEETDSERLTRLRRLEEAQKDLETYERNLRYHLRPVVVDAAFDCNQFMSLVESEFPSLIRNPPKESSDSKIDDFLSDIEEETTGETVDQLLADLMRRFAALKPM
jgi:hypothetical protein